MSWLLPNWFWNAGRHVRDPAKGEQPCTTCITEYQGFLQCMEEWGRGWHWALKPRHTHGHITYRMGDATAEQRKKGPFSRWCGRGWYLYGRRVTHNPSSDDKTEQQNSSGLNSWQEPHGSQIHLYCMERTSSATADEWSWWWWCYWWWMLAVLCVQWYLMFTKQPEGRKVFCVPWNKWAAEVSGGSQTKVRDIYFITGPSED